MQGTSQCVYKMLFPWQMVVSSAPRLTPIKVSLPPSPDSVSLPPSPKIVSLCEVPERLLFPLVPIMVAIVFTSACERQTQGIVKLINSYQ